MQSWEEAKRKWPAAKPAVIAFVAGLVIGPFVSNSFGWQVTSSRLRGQVRTAVIEQQALFCEERAREEVKDPAKLDYQARRKLAEKWAVMPGEDETDPDLIWACSDKLEN